MRALYGFDPQLAPFANKSPMEQAKLLQSWGLTGVFGGYENKAFVDALHELGLKIYAEFNCFGRQTYWEQFPNCRPITADGTLLEPDDWYYGANPVHRGLRKHRLTELAGILHNYAIDGVWLDYIRWACRWENPHPKLIPTSFDVATIKQFSNDTNIAVNRSNPVQNLLMEHHAEWTKWRCEQITKWVAEARRLVNEIRPQATLGMFSIPWLPSDFDGAILSIIGQDFEALVDYIDVFSPMTYHLLCGRSIEWIDGIRHAIKQQTGKIVIPIIQSVDAPSELSVDDYGMALAKTNNGDGVIVFTLKGVIEHPKKLERTIQVFSR